jgi:hypothetical protein
VKCGSALGRRRCAPIGFGHCLRLGCACTERAPSQCRSTRIFYVDFLAGMGYRRWLGNIQNNLQNSNFNCGHTALFLTEVLPERWVVKKNFRIRVWKIKKRKSSKVTFFAELFPLTSYLPCRSLFEILNWAFPCFPTAHTPKYQCVLHSECFVKKKVLKEKKSRPKWQIFNS